MLCEGIRAPIRLLGKRTIEVATNVTVHSKAEPNARGHVTGGRWEQVRGRSVAPRHTQEADPYSPLQHLAGGVWHPDDVRFGGPAPLRQAARQSSNRPRVSNPRNFPPRLLPRLAPVRTLAVCLPALRWNWPFGKEGGQRQGLSNCVRAYLQKPLSWPRSKR